MMDSAIQTAEEVTKKQAISDTLQNFFRQRRFILITILLSTAASLAHLFFIRNHPTFHFPIMDSFDYLRDARITLGEEAAQLPYYHSPLYGWFLAAVLLIFGKQLFMIRLLQILLNGFSIALIYLLGKRLFSEKEARIAAVIWAFYGPLIFYSSEILNVTIILVTYLAAFYTILVAHDKPSPLTFLLAGTVTGVAALARPDILPFAAIVTIATLALRQRYSLKKSSLWAALFAVAVALPLLLVGVRNYKVSGEFRFLPANGGLNFYQGNNPDYEKTIGIRLASWHTLVDLPLVDGTPEEISTASHKQYYYRKSLAFMTGDPKGYLACLWYKFCVLSNSYELPETFDLYSYRKYSPVLAVLVWRIGSFAFPFGLLLPLAIVGTYLVRHRWRELWWLGALSGSLLISLLVYWNSSRYRLSLMPILILLASATILKMWEWIRQKEKQPLVSVAAPLLLLIVATNLPLKHFSQSFNYDAEAYALAGMQAVNEGQRETGFTYLQQAINLNPDNEYVNYLMAKSLVTTAQADAALPYYNKAVESNPAYYPAYSEMGLLLAEKGRFDEAYQCFAKTLEINPRQCTSYYYIGEIHLLKGQLDEAADQFTKALEINPQMYMAYNELGVVWSRKGNLEKAIECFSKTVELNPAYELGKVNLNDALQQLKKTRAG